MVRESALFFRIDENMNGYLSKDECMDFFSFALPHLSPDERLDIFEAADVSDAQQLSRLKFCLICVDLLWDVPTELLDLAVQTLDGARRSNLAGYKKHWEAVAAKV